MQKILLSIILSFAFLRCGIAQEIPKRELRGAWIATYANIDWPNRSQTPAQQRAAFLLILDHHKATGLNVLYIQVRSQCDAMYQSDIEPWSADLTGVQGRAPAEPDWDPMQFMIDECHKRGIEFHAWLNPYRAIANVTQLPLFAPNHVTKVHPEWLLSQGNLRVLDPGLAPVRDYVTSVIADIVQRYDVDGIHFDDYFYPAAAGIGVIPYNDDASYTADPRGFAPEQRGDWRRDNVNILIKRVAETIKDLKPWVKFGVSPTGIYRNSTNPEIGSNTRGLEHYTTLHADSRKWLQEGWVDYIAPQVYWFIGQSGADYGIVTPWWNNNSFGRHIYIGLAGYKVNDPAQGPSWANPSQIPNQVRMNRSLANVYGQAVYNTSSLRATTRLGFRDSLRLNFYRKPALLPAMPWRDDTPPAAPSGLFATRSDDGSMTLTWTKPEEAGSEFDKVRQFAIYRSENPAINLAGANNLLAVTNTAVSTFTDVPENPGVTYYYKVTALDRFHNESAPSNTTDYAAPALACPEDQKLALDASCAAVLPDFRSLATVTDDVSLPGEITVTQLPTPGTAVSGTGVVTITLTATDASGKSSVCTFGITPEDNIEPVVITRNITRPLSNGTVAITADDINDGTWDNCGLDMSTLKVSPAAFTCANMGPNTVTLTVADKSGNTASATATVTVTGTEPLVTVSFSRMDQTFTGLPQNTIALGYGAQSLTLTAANSTSAAGNSRYQWTPAAGLSSTDGETVEFTPAAAGLYTFTVVATNEFGCTGSSVATIRVIDVRCGDLNDKVQVCIRTGNRPKPGFGIQICTSPGLVALLLRNSGSLDACIPAAGVGADTFPATEVTLLTAYPNPFTDQVTINFNAGVAIGNAVLEIYDPQGNKLHRLYEGGIEAGKVYSFRVNMRQSGGRVFFARLITGGKAYTYKLIRGE